MKCKYFCILIFCVICINTTLVCNAEILSDNYISYNWFLVYVIYFTIWGYIFLLSLISSFYKVPDLINSFGYYELKYDSNNLPIKPLLNDFQLNQKVYNDINTQMDLINGFDISTVLIAPISMILINIILDAPNFIFPIFTGSNTSRAYVFWYVSVIALYNLKTKVYYLFNAEKIYNYNTYNKALKKYNIAKNKYDAEQMLIAEQKKRDYERELWLKKEYWYNLNPFEFEHKIGELFKDLGYTVLVTQKSNDGGIDIIAKHNGITTGIQCKRYRDKVGVKAVRELWGSKDGYNCKIDQVILVALSGITRSGQEFIKNIPEYELWTIDVVLNKAQEVNFKYKYS